jgi:hypothetical protein
MKRNMGQGSQELTEENLTVPMSELRELATSSKGKMIKARRNADAMSVALQSI